MLILNAAMAPADLFVPQGTRVLVIVIIIIIIILTSTFRSRYKGYRAEICTGCITCE